MLRLGWSLHGLGEVIDGECVRRTLKAIFYSRIDMSVSFWVSDLSFLSDLAISL